MPYHFKSPIFHAIDSNGNPMPGAKLYFYEAGTTTPLNVYSDTALSTAISQPVVADSAGRFEDIFMAEDDYKVILKSSADVTEWTVDNFTSSATGSTNLLNGIGTAAAARTAIGAGSATDVAANTTSLASIQSQVTAVGGTLRTLAGKADVSTSELATGFGTVVTARYSYTNSASTTLTDLPNDGTVPQSTEGGSVFSVNITPKTATSMLLVRGIVNISDTSGRAMAVAVFVGGVASAQRVFATRDARDTSIPFEYEYTPGSTGSVNVMVRAGRNGGTCTLNGVTSWGSASVSHMIVEELETV